MTNFNIQKGIQLLNMERYQEASVFFINALQSNPDDILSRYCLGICHLQLNDYKKAESIAKEIISDDPEFYGGYELMSDYFSEINQYNSALNWIKEAIRLNIENADLWGKKSVIQYYLKDMDAAIQSAITGLSYDAENTLCLNMKTRVHASRGESDDVYNNILKTLEVNPQNAYSHANAGWALLERRNYTKAKYHFLEALKINPNISIAQSGMKEAVKATNPLYKLLLMYGFWMSRWGNKMQWVIIIAIYLFYRFMGYLSTHYPFISPVFYALLAFLFLSWLLSPLSNLALMGDRYARYLLDKNERIGAYLTGSLVLLSILAFVSIFLVAAQYKDYSQVIGIFLLLLSIPAGTMLMPETEESRKKLILFSTGILAIGLMGLFSMFTSEKPGIFGTLFVLGIFIYQWVFNAEMIKQSNSED